MVDADVSEIRRIVPLSYSACVGRERSLSPWRAAATDCSPNSTPTAVGDSPRTPSDAYATGQALAALNQAAAVAPSHAAFQKGLRYLLAKQKPDGTWLVASRIHPPAPVSPPYVESGLPYGHNQFISAMGSCWAAAALLLALPESPAPPASLDLSSLQPTGVPSWVETVLFGGEDDLRQLLESGWDPNSATRKGTTALMMAAPDAEKTALLIRHGANVNVKSATRYTALMIAASHHATRSVSLLLNQDVDSQPKKSEPALFGATPLFFAVSSGDLESVEALRNHGAEINPTMVVGGMFPTTALEQAAQQGDSEMVSVLIHWERRLMKKIGMTASQLSAGRC